MLVLLLLPIPLVFVSLCILLVGIIAVDEMASAGSKSQRNKPVQMAPKWGQAGSNQNPPMVQALFGPVPLPAAPQQVLAGPVGAYAYSQGASAYPVYTAHSAPYALMPHQARAYTAPPQNPAPVVAAPAPAVPAPAPPPPPPQDGDKVVNKLVAAVVILCLLMALIGYQFMKLFINNWRQTNLILMYEQDLAQVRMMLRQLQDDATPCQVAKENFFSWDAWTKNDHEHSWMMCNYDAFDFLCHYDQWTPEVCIKVVVLVVGLISFYYRVASRDLGHLSVVCAIPLALCTFVSGGQGGLVLYAVHTLGVAGYFAMYGSYVVAYYYGTMWGFCFVFTFLCTVYVITLCIQATTAAADSWFIALARDIIRGVLIACVIGFTSFFPLGEGIAIGLLFAWTCANRYIAMLRPWRQVRTYADGKSQVTVGDDVIPPFNEEETIKSCKDRVKFAQQSSSWWEKIIYCCRTIPRYEAKIGINKQHSCAAFNSIVEVVGSSGQVGNAFKVRSALVTVKHVVEAASPGGIEVGNVIQVKRGEEVKDAKVIKIIEDSESPDHVVVMTDPFGLPSLKQAKRMDVPFAVLYTKAQGEMRFAVGVINTDGSHDMDTERGNSGSPITTVDGKVLAIHTAGSIAINYATFLPDCETDWDVVMREKHPSEIKLLREQLALQAKEIEELKRAQLCADLPDTASVVSDGDEPDDSAIPTVPEAKYGKKKGKSKKRSARFLSQEKYEELINDLGYDEAVRHIRASRMLKRDEPEYGFECNKDLFFRACYESMGEKTGAVIDMVRVIAQAEKDARDKGTGSGNRCEPPSTGGRRTYRELGDPLFQVGQAHKLIQPHHEDFPVPVLGRLPIGRAIEKLEPVTCKVTRRYLDLDLPEVKEYVPAVWSSGAYAKSFEKYTWSVSSKFSSEAHEYAIEYLDEAFAHCRNYRAIPLDETNKPTDTSPGYPWCLKYPTERELHEARPHLLRETYLLMMANEYRCMWYCFLKNEMLKLSKVTEQDIRGVCIPDVCFSRVQLMLDQHLNQLIKSKPVRSPSAIGFSPFYGTGDLLKRLFEVYPHIYEQDFKRFDGTIPERLFLLIREWRYGIMFPDDQMKYKDLMRNIDWNLMHRATVLPTQLVVEVTQGNPSGQVSTSTDNTLINVYMAAYVQWLLGDLNWRVLAFGDDRILGRTKYVDPEVEAKLVLDHFGMQLPAQKMKLFDRFEGVTFCGGTYQTIKGHCVPVFNGNKIVASLQNPHTAVKNVDTLWGKLFSAYLLLYWSDLRFNLRRALDKLRVWRVDTWYMPDQVIEDLYLRPIQ
uniref:Non-structural polyprotein 1AB n=1 Tax=Wenling pterygotrigla hemisticta astrovirus TaxID=2116419 RepID=A0A2P1GME7_9VIRU|nr:ORF1ab [Wenling pterygotrigla hemisticta astrovirus]